MDDPIDELLIDVRASTSGFAADIEAMRTQVGGSLLDGFTKAGNVLESGLLSAIRKGSLGFDDLQRTASRALDQIAAQALQLGLDKLFGSGGDGLGNLFGGVLGSLFGLPGRATGGPVAPGRGYVVGERGPELFVPTSAGRVEPSLAGSAQPREVRVSIQLSQPRGASTPAILERSSRQVASALRRALM